MQSLPLQNKTNVMFDARARASNVMHASRHDVQAIDTERNENLAHHLLAAAHETLDDARFADLMARVSEWYDARFSSEIMTPIKRVDSSQEEIAFLKGEIDAWNRLFNETVIRFGEVVDGLRRRLSKHELVVSTDEDEISERVFSHDKHTRRINLIHAGR